MTAARSALTIARLLVLLLLPATFARAQQAADRLAPAIAAYNDLDYAAAASQLRAAIALTGAQRLSDADRARALMYLGATEHFRGIRPSAVDAFRTLLILDPRFRPDQVIFPPEVVALFQETRIGVRAVAVVIAPSSEIVVPTDRLPIRLYASSLHDIRVRVTTSLGAPERVLYEGVIGDSLVVSWDGRDAGGRVAAASRYLLRITSRNPNGANEREVQVPLEVEPVPVDTLPWPGPVPASELRPESIVRANGVQQFVTGLLGAAVAVGLPTLVGASEASSTRFAVGGAIGLSGVIGLATAARPRPIPENIAYNTTLRAARAAEVQRVQNENAQRRALTRVRVRAERAVTVEIR